MSISSSEIESIVRRVLAQFASAQTIDSTERLELNDKLITLETIKGRTSGVRQLLVRKKAVVTPAARDLLRSNKIEIVYDLPAKAGGGSEAKYQVQRQNWMAIAGYANWFLGLKNQICPRQADWIGDQTDDSRLIENVITNISSGRRGMIAISSMPEAVACELNRNPKLRAVVVNSWQDGVRVLKRFPANTLILDNQTWNIPATANLVRTYYGHLKQQTA